MITDEAHVLEACDRLVDFGIWPRQKIEYRAWLGNFDTPDRPLAVHMLSRFTFVSNELVDQLFMSAFQSLSNTSAALIPGAVDRASSWRNFCSRLLVVPVMGERPTPADSGWGFARKARQLLGVPESRLLEPAAAVANLASGSNAPIVFVDDFVGSGDQFLSTWRRTHETEHGDASFSKFAGRFQAAYCNVFTTEYGRNRIRVKVPKVTLAMGNVIPADHGFAVANSTMWPSTLRQAGVDLARRSGERLGFTKSDGSLRDWRGYHGLGLGIAMEDSIPDANLPLFFDDTHNWQPLVRRA